MIRLSIQNFRSIVCPLNGTWWEKINSIFTESGFYSCLRWLPHFNDTKTWIKQLVCRWRCVQQKRHKKYSESVACKVQTMFTIFFLLCIQCFWMENQLKLNGFSGQTNNIISPICRLRRIWLFLFASMNIFRCSCYNHLKNMRKMTQNDICTANIHRFFYQWKKKTNEVHTNYHLVK